MRALVCALLVATACGRGSDGERGGGGANLPASGVGPYKKLIDRDFSTPLEEPLVVALPGVDLAEPAPLDDGERLRIFYARGDAIYRSDLAASLRELPGDPQLVLAASEPWEGGALLAPAIVDDGERVVLYYQGRDGGIGRAESDDRGDSFVKTGQVLAAGTSPAALRVREDWFLYHGRGDAPGVFVATSADGVAFTARAEPVLASGASPAAAGGVTATGAIKIGLYFDTPGDNDSTTIGFAGSTDGLTFEVHDEPVIDPIPPSERAAGVLLHPAQALLFFNQDATGKLAIALATSP